MTNSRDNPIEIDKNEFKKIGHQLIDSIADFFDTIAERPVTTGETPQQLQSILGNDSLPETGSDLSKIFAKATSLLFDHSLLNGHPKFFGYITATPAPAGVLAELLAAAVNPNVGANVLSPIATEIEKQTVKWLARFIGVGESYGGLLVSGGNMANFTAFLAARTAKGPKSIKAEGIENGSQKMTVYCAKTTHTWIEKAVILFGLGTNAVRWISTDDKNVMDNTELENSIKKDKENGCHPLMVIGTAGDVSTGAVDDLKGIGALCKKYDLWFHVDGAYGIPAAVLPEFKTLFSGVEEADSIALDPHKWLYSPLEAGCILVKDPNHLIAAYSSHPVYYNFSSDEPSTLNFYEYGLQNSRGFRALKVWIMLQQMGINGYQKLIAADIELSRLLFELADKHKELQAITQNLSITTFRYVPLNFDERDESFLNTLNEQLLNSLQKKGKVFLSNAVIQGKYCLRCCIVNFRTTRKDIEELVEIIVKEGKNVPSP
ncbi:MAG: aspartate aminotransferase family protein [Ginsengibacter sp.]